MRRNLTLTFWNFKKTITYLNFYWTHISTRVWKKITLRYKMKNYLWTIAEICWTFYFIYSNRFIMKLQKGSCYWLIVKFWSNGNSLRLLKESFMMKRSFKNYKLKDKLSSTILLESLFLKFTMMSKSFMILKLKNISVQFSIFTRANIK